MKLHRSKYQDIAFYSNDIHAEGAFPLIQRYTGYMYTTHLYGKIENKCYIVNNSVVGFSYDIFNNNTFRYYHI